MHPDLVACAEKALSYGLMDFSVAQGVRTEAQQAALYAQGRSAPGKIVTWTMQSNHLLQSDGYGHAPDLVPTSTASRTGTTYKISILLLL